MLPTFIVIGGMKCGTTSLHYYLGLHPEIAVSRQKELNFFVAERNWGRGLSWYERQFRGGAVQIGESSPNYTSYPQFEGVPERMVTVVPDARLIYLVRDPIARMVSDYVHRVASGGETRALADALAPTGENRYVDRSRYRLQLERYLQHYPRDRILVVVSEDLMLKRAATLERVYAWLGVDPSFSSRRFRLQLHEGQAKRVLSPTARRISRATRAVLRRRLPLDLGWHAEQLLVRPFSRPVPRPELSVRLRSELADILRPEVEWLREFSADDLTGWDV